MKHNHKSTAGMDIKICGIYTFVNDKNYVTTVKVSRVTEKSIFVFQLLDNGNFSTTEFREGVTNFRKYTLQTETPGNPEFTTHKVMYKGREVEAINFGKL